jgi:transposase
VDPDDQVMLSLFDQTQVYLARDPVDMRKQIDGLALIVQAVFELDPFQSALFAFCNRQRDKLKVLYWHNNGFCLLYKRLEKGRFQWPRDSAATQLCSERELKWLLEGLSLESLSTNPRLKYQSV